MRALIAHCWTGTPDAGWYPVLSRHLQALGFAVSVPRLPDSDDPDPVAWHHALRNAVGDAPSDLLFIGHSLGALAALHCLADTSGHAAALVLVAPPAGHSDLAVVRRFAVDADTLRRAAAKAARIAVVVSDADPYLLPTPRAVAERFIALGAELVMTPGKGHLSPTSGFTPLPEIEPVIGAVATELSSGRASAAARTGAAKAASAAHGRAS
jgi:uncharacterized protein